MESNAAQQPGAESVQQELSSDAAKASIAEEQYQQALKIRCAILHAGSVLGSM
jgi:hypothetical protein